MFAQTIEQKLIRFPVIMQLLRFGAIGILNTAVDFIILNLLAKQFGIESGTQLGVLNVAGSLVAIIQSYFWNKYWTFNSATVSLYKNFVRLVLVGILGGAAFIAVLISANNSAPASTYLIILGVFLVLQLIIWKLFNLGNVASTQSLQVQFTIFFIVSVVGLLINSFLVSVVSNYLVGAVDFSNPDLIKNAAKIVATAASLIWNFIGYKLLYLKNN